MCVLVLAHSVACADLALDDHVHAAVADSNLRRIADLAKQVDSLWPEQSARYFALQERLASALATMSATNTVAWQELGRLASNILARPCPADVRLALPCFQAKDSIAGRLANASVASTNLGFLYARMLAGFLGEVRAVVIADFKPLRVLPNVSPPVGLGPGAAGIDPKAIADPVARAAYERTIQDNLQRAATNELQFALRQIEDRVNQTLAAYWKELFRWQEVSLLSLAGATEDDRRQWRRAVVGEIDPATGLPVGFGPRPAGAGPNANVDPNTGLPLPRANRQ